MLNHPYAGGCDILAYADADARYDTYKLGTPVRQEMSFLCRISPLYPGISTLFPPWNESQSLAVVMVS